MVKPESSKELTPPELKCLSVIKDILNAGRQPSILEVARLLDIGKSGAQRHMDALRAKGKLLGPRLVGEWRIPRAGQRALEKKT
jgi:predicted ArsR family transcriptional regulator